MNRLGLLRLASADQLRVLADFMGFYAGAPTPNQWRKLHNWAARFYTHPRTK